VSIQSLPSIIEINDYQQDLLSKDRIDQQAQEFETWRKNSKYSSSPEVKRIPWKIAGPREIDQEHPLASRECVNPVACELRIINVF